MSVLLALLLMIPLPSDELARQPKVHELMLRLVRNGRAGFEHREEAAFIVRTSSGNFLSIEWPSDGRLDSAEWRGPFPAGTVAIAHTHPTHLPMPSSVDIATAREKHVPVYVVTPLTITRTDG